MQEPDLKGGWELDWPWGQEKEESKGTEAAGPVCSLTGPEETQLSRGPRVWPPRGGAHTGEQWEEGGSLHPPRAGAECP